MEKVSYAGAKAGCQKPAINDWAEPIYGSGVNQNV